MTFYIWSFHLPRALCKTPSCVFLISCRGNLIVRLWAHRLRIGWERIACNPIITLPTNCSIGASTWRKHEWGSKEWFNERVAQSISLPLPQTLSMCWFKRFRKSFFFFAALNYRAIFQASDFLSLRLTLERNSAAFCQLPMQQSSESESV